MSALLGGSMTLAVIRLLAAMTLSVVVAGTSGDTVQTKERRVTEVGKGVYVIRHKDTPQGFPSGNTVVVIGDREVFVVDSGFLASDASEDIAQIRHWTDKPVRYLVNTAQRPLDGKRNIYGCVSLFGDYSHTETKIMEGGYLYPWFARHSKTIAELQKAIDSGTDAQRKPLTEAQRVKAKRDLAGEEKVVAEFPNFVPRLPNLTFEREFGLDLGNRVVQIKHLGRGNTAGDAVVFLPNEKILITGDIVVHPVPYLCSGYPPSGLEPCNG